MELVLNTGHKILKSVFAAAAATDLTTNLVPKESVKSAQAFFELTMWMWLNAINAIRKFIYHVTNKPKIF